MFISTKLVPRANVTIDDRRDVFAQARVRKAADIALMPQEAFIRTALKDRLNWPRRDPAPKAVLEAAKQMAAALAPQLEGTRAERARKVGEAALEAWKAKHPTATGVVAAEQPAA